MSSFFYLIFAIDPSQFTLRLNQAISFSSQFVFFAGSLSLCNLLLLLPPLILPLPIFSLQLFLHLLLFLSQISSHFKHLIIRFVHFNKIIRWSLISDFHLLELLQNILSILQGYFIRVDLFCCFIKVLWKSVFGSRNDILVCIHLRRFVLNTSLEAASLGIFYKISPSQFPQEVDFSIDFLNLVEFLSSQLFIKMLHHSKNINIMIQAKAEYQFINEYKMFLLLQMVGVQVKQKFVCNNRVAYFAVQRKKQNQNLGRWLLNKYSHSRSYNTSLFKTKQKSELLDEKGDFCQSATDIVISLPIMERHVEEYIRCHRLTIFTMSLLAQTMFIYINQPLQTAIYHIIEQRINFNVTLFQQSEAIYKLYLNSMIEYQLYFILLYPK